MNRYSYIDTRLLICYNYLYDSLVFTIIIRIKYVFCRLTFSEF